MNIVKLLGAGDVMKATGVGRETLRFYESKGLVKPISRSAAGYRKYTPGVVELIEFIKGTQAAGFSLKEIKELLSLRATTANTCSNVESILTRKMMAIDESLATLQRKRTLIASMVGNCCAVNDCKP